MISANPHRGDVLLSLPSGDLVLRPSFQALVAAEQEIGSLLALAARASTDGVPLQKMAVLFHHCARAVDPAVPDADVLGQRMLAAGLMPCLDAFQSLLAGLLGDERAN